MPSAKTVARFIRRTFRRSRCSMLRLNLVLNNLGSFYSKHYPGKHSADAPYHRTGDKLMTFDYMVSNPPFKLDFSDWRDRSSTPSKTRTDFSPGIPKIPNKDKDKMAIYLLFIQHIIFSLSAKGEGGSRRSNRVPNGSQRRSEELERNWSTTGCSAAWFQCRAISLRQQAQMFQSCS